MCSWLGTFVCVVRRVFMKSMICVSRVLCATLCGGSSVCLFACVCVCVEGELVVCSFTG